MEKITKENFNKYKTKLSELIKNNTPKNSKEFSNFCDKIFGFKVDNSFVSAHESNGDFGVGIRYEIRSPDADQIMENEIFRMWLSYYSHLDEKAHKNGCCLIETNPLKMLLKATFGELCCGGIASCYYGQTDCEGLDHTQVYNLLNWYSQGCVDRVVETLQNKYAKNLKTKFGVDSINTEEA